MGKLEKIFSNEIGFVLLPGSMFYQMGEAFKYGFLGKPYEGKSDQLFKISTKITILLGASGVEAIRLWGYYKLFEPHIHNFMKQI